MDAPVEAPMLATGCGVCEEDGAVVERMPVELAVDTLEEFIDDVEAISLDSGVDDDGTALDMDVSCDVVAVKETDDGIPWNPVL